MPKKLDDLIASELVDYDLSDRMKEIVLTSLKGAQESLESLKAREEACKRIIAKKRADLQADLDDLRDIQEEHAAEIAASKDLGVLIYHRKITAVVAP